MPKIVLCVTGSVAGIKAAELVTKIQHSFDVKVVATSHGHVFLERPAAGWNVPEFLTDSEDYKDCEADPLHIQLADWADVLVFAPLSANSLAKLSLGLADNLASRLFRAWNICEKPVIIAPAMNTKMWTHPATATHIETLCGWGAILVKPVSKMLACGDVGVGAMASVGDILTAIVERTQHKP